MGGGRGFPKIGGNFLGVIGDMQGLYRDIRQYRKCLMFSSTEILVRIPCFERGWLAVTGSCQLRTCIVEGAHAFTVLKPRKKNSVYLLSSSGARITRSAVTGSNPSSPLMGGGHYGDYISPFQQDAAYCRGVFWGPSAACLLPSIHSFLHH